MSASVLEALMSAEINIDNAMKMGPAVLPVAKSQLHNAVVLLEKGYPLHTLVEPLLEKHETVDNVPDFEDGE